MSAPIRFAAFPTILALLLGAFVATPALADDASLMRFPTLHGDRIVFESHGSLWSVDRAGGSAASQVAYVCGPTAAEKWGAVG